MCIGLGLWLYNQRCTRDVLGMTAAYVYMGSYHTDLLWLRGINKTFRII
jgi:hypothetical protein